MKEYFSKLGELIVKNNSEILLGMGIAGMVSTTIYSVKVTPKALRLLEARKEELEVDDLDVPEKIKVTWKCYIPAAISCCLSISCLILSNSIYSKRTKVLATAYALSESALREYKDKVIETIGEKKEQKIRDSISQDRIDKNPVNDTEIVITGNGDVRCYDSLCGLYFTSNMEKIKSVENEINKRILSHGYASLNDFYEGLGLEPNVIGSELGWRIDTGVMDISFASLLDSTGTPCMVLDYDIEPVRNYDKWL